MTKLFRTCLLGTLIVAGFQVNAAKPQHDLYTDLGAATIDNGTSTSTGLHYKIGYNYYFTPFIALDLNYTSTQTLKNPNETPGSNEFSYDYKGWGAGVKAEHHFAKRFTAYAKGGANSLTITEKAYDQGQGAFVETEESGIYPYASFGVDIVAPMNYLKFNFNYTYQMLEDDASSSAFSVGATLRY